MGLQLWKVLLLLRIIVLVKVLHDCGEEGAVLLTSGLHGLNLVELLLDVLEWISGRE